MLSDFSRGILKILEGAAQPLSSSEIADRMSNDGGEKYVGSYVSVYLRHALQDYAEEVEEDKWIRIKKTEDEQTPGSHRGRDEHDGRSNQDEVAGNLESLDRSVIRLLALSDEPLKAWEIAERISSNSRMVTKRAVNRRLHGILEDFVFQDAQYRWLIEDDYREYFADGLAGNAADATQEERSVSRGEATSSEELEALARELMRGPVKPLKTSELAEHVRSRGHDVSKSEVKRILKDHLDDEVWFIPKEGWCLQLKVDPQEIGIESHSSPELTKSGTKSKERKEEGVGQNPLGEELGFSPNGLAVYVNSQLETAKLIVTVLDLASNPLSVLQLATVLRKLGYQSNEEEIETCLRSILDRFVVETEMGYYELSSHASHDPTEDEQLTEPVDADTRASLSGGVYAYEFAQGQHDTSALFSSEIRGGTVRIELNTSHPLFEDIRVITSGGRERKNSLRELKRALRILIAAWVDLESNLQGRPRDIAEELRTDWGRTARLLLRSGSGS